MCWWQSLGGRSRANETINLHSSYGVWIFPKSDFTFKTRDRNLFKFSNFLFHYDFQKKSVTRFHEFIHSYLCRASLILLYCDIKALMRLLSYF